MEPVIKEIFGSYMSWKLDDHPSLTVGKIKNGYKLSKHGLCSCFLFRDDMCYIMIYLSLRGRKLIPILFTITNLI